MLGVRGAYSTRPFPDPQNPLGRVSVPKRKVHIDPGEKGARSPEKRLATLPYPRPHPMSFIPRRLETQCAPPPTRSAARLPPPDRCAQRPTAFSPGQGTRSPSAPSPGCAVLGDPPRSQSRVHAGPTKLAALSPNPHPLSPSLHPCTLAPPDRQRLP